MLGVEAAQKGGLSKIPRSSWFCCSGHTEGRQGVGSSRGQRGLACYWAVGSLLNTLGPYFKKYWLGGLFLPDVFGCSFLFFLSLNLESNSCLILSGKSVDSHEGHEGRYDMLSERF